MAVPDGVDASDGQQDWPARSYLTYIIPLATDFRLEDALAGATSYRDAFLSIEQREWLFFDFRRDC
ncbi:hypothetical protein VTK73DRAFT_8619 [Phialemonium thermophilum]|uniref:Uncharacterized protein n=1 Tax=Phialemonium thermophilum TaxID=223376 RepID=A0ABR3W7F1_9PEZI